MQMTAEQKLSRAIVRAYAKLYRDALKFGRRYREYNPAVYEKWCVKAGMHLAEAVRERDSQKNRKLF